MVIWDRYGKSITAVVLAIATAVQAADSDHRVTPLEWVQISIAVVTALLVWLVPVAPQWPWAKSILGTVLAALNVLATLLLNGWNTGSYPEALLAALTAILVRYAPAHSTATGAEAT